MCRLLYVVVNILIAASAQGQTVPPHGDQTVTIRADGVPIGTLLAELGRRHRLEKITIQPEVQQHPVWITLDQVPLRTALARILEASGLDFAMSGRRVIVGDWTGPARADALALRTSAEEPQPAAATGQAARAAAIQAAEAEQHAITAAMDNESTILAAPPVRFVANGENITYLEPNFVPYKLRPEVRALRMAIDVAKIP